MPGFIESDSLEVWLPQTAFTQTDDRPPGKESLERVVAASDFDRCGAIAFGSRHPKACAGSERQRRGPEGGLEEACAEPGRDSEGSRTRIQTVRRITEGLPDYFCIAAGLPGEQVEGNSARAKLPARPQIINGH